MEFFVTSLLHLLLCKMRNLRLIFSTSHLLTCYWWTVWMFERNQDLSLFHTCTSVSHVWMYCFHIGNFFMCDVSSSFILHQTSSTFTRSISPTYMGMDTVETRTLHTLYKQMHKPFFHCLTWAFPVLGELGVPKLFLFARISSTENLF